MSDVRIERVEPCEHGAMTAHVIDWSARPLEDCDGGSRSVLSGFPPEAVEAAMKVIFQGTYRGHENRQALLDHTDAALAAAWDVLLRSDLVLRLQEYPDHPDDAGQMGEPK